MTGCAQNEMLLDGVSFALCWEKSGSAFFVSEQDEDGGCGEDTGKLEYSIDCRFHRGVFRGETAAPSLSINAVPTDARTLEALTGHRFSVESIQEAHEREDTFCLCEHEPLVRYCVEILAFRNGRAHIRCEGTAVLDGYARPFTTAPFLLDCWLPVIRTYDDWSKFYR